MKTDTRDIGETTAEIVQLVGAVIACMIAVWWAWSLSDGNLLGFVLLLLLAALFIAPLVAWGLPVVALIFGIFARAMRPGRSQR
ncbi:hypothetical protein BI347_20885 [Chromobacterium sphagni]|uniref:Uncharacterized protein n=1 Tax=Chromobacterium sphagni TaxID=1903179 RepID=A0A1S1WSP1_9NEIS|nr:hypothetical protein [Chromobacterium sphagni]OHX10256.1 hypothetical protein BI347_20885 [Chromobacterium sphagni]